MTKVFYELSVEIHKLQEALHFFYLSGGFPFLDCFDFVVLYLHLSSSNYYF